jgi:hypothetical protein
VRATETGEALANCSGLELSESAQLREKGMHMVATELALEEAGPQAWKEAAERGRVGDEEGTRELKAKRPSCATCTWLARTRSTERYRPPPSYHQPEPCSWPPPSPLSGSMKRATTALDPGFTEVMLSRRTRKGV